MRTTNSYVQMALLTLLLSALIYLFIYVVFAALRIEFPTFLHVSVSVLSAGYIVYKYIGFRLG